MYHAGSPVKRSNGWQNTSNVVFQCNRQADMFRNMGEYSSRGSVRAVAAKSDVPRKTVKRRPMTAKKEKGISSVYTKVLGERSVMVSLDGSLM
jgi:hypothetical protein